jgi:hypothetical protein
MSLLINSLDEKQVINSYNFARVADIVFSETVTKDQYSKLNDKDSEIIEEMDSSIFYVKKNFKLKENSIIFTNTYLVESLFNKLYSSNFKNITIITSQTDHAINDGLYNLKPSCVSNWYSTNVSCNKKDLFSIPLGLANEYSHKNLIQDNFQVFSNNVEKVNKLYLNFEENTNYFHRNKLRRKLSNKSFVVSDKLTLDNSEYLKNLNKYKFVLCPWGNGIDTHRVWETLYAGSLPIIPSHSLFISIFGDSLFLFNKVYEIENILSSINNKKFIFENEQILNMDYWSDKIINSDYTDNLQANENIKFSLQELTSAYNNLKLKERKLKKSNTFKRKVHNKVFNF